MMRKDVVAWYLKEMESELESEAQVCDRSVSQMLSNCMHRQPMKRVLFGW